MNATNIQLRGHCQCCGRIQASTSGLLAKHGYTVKGGWFQGTCQGSDRPPIEIDHSFADGIVETLREIARAAAANAHNLKVGRIHPATVQGRWDVKTREYAKVAWADAGEYQREVAVRSAILSEEQRATYAARDADGLAALVVAVHGKPLAEVDKPAAPAPVLAGERRDAGKGSVLVADYVRGARVYWKCLRGDRTFKGWTGTQAWRRYPIAA